MTQETRLSPAHKLILLADIKQGGDSGSKLLSQESVLDDIRDSLELLPPSEADAFSSNLTRFLALEADRRGLVRPGSVKGKPHVSLPKEFSLSPRAATTMLGVQIVAENLRNQNTSWAIFENKVLIAHHQVIQASREVVKQQQMMTLAMSGF